MTSTDKTGASQENGHNLMVEIAVKQPSCFRRSRRFLKDNLFLVANVVGIVLGFLVGLLVRTSHPDPTIIMWLGMPGELYLRILKCIILPLIVCSVIDGTSSTDPKTNGKISLVALAYIVTLNAVGGIIGLVLCVLIRPGVGKDLDVSDGGVDTAGLKTMDIIADFIRNVFPANMVGAALQKTQTRYMSREVVTALNVSGQLVNRTSTELVKSLGTSSSTNILGLVVISAALGVAASQAGSQAKPFVDFFKSGAHVIFRLFHWIKWTTPPGSASLIISSLAGLEDLGPALRAMGVFTLIIVGANLLLLQLVLPCVIFTVIRRRNPLVFFVRSARSWLVAFGAINSTIPYPEYIRVLTTFSVAPHVTEYVLPFCVTLNRCGSCLFITAASVFVVQYADADLGAGEIVVIALLGILSSLAIPSVNSASVVSVVIIVESLGINPGGAVGLIMAMEWVNDRARTSSNAIHHILCVLSTWRACKKDISSVASEESTDKTSQL